MSKKGRVKYLTYRNPCPRCGNRLVAVIAAGEGHHPYLHCVDCGLGFFEPEAIRDWVGEVFQDRVLPGGVRRATREDLGEAGWVQEEFH